MNPNICGLCCTRIENLSVRRGSAVILDDINLHIHCGELTALIGPNGAGKTTLLKTILGQEAHSGRLQYLDADSLKTVPRIGYVPQHLAFDPGSPLSVLDVFAAALARRPVWFGSGKKTAAIAAQSLARLEADHLLYKKLGTLSGGELQRVMLALALEPLPDLLLLDEPVSGIDPQGLQIFLGIVASLPKKYDLSVIIVSHDINLVSHFADRIVLLNKRLEFVGTPAELFATPHGQSLETLAVSSPSDNIKTLHGYRHAQYLPGTGAPNQGGQP